MNNNKMNNHKVIFNKLNLLKIGGIGSSQNINTDMVRLLSNLASVGIYVNDSNKLLYSDASADMVLDIMTTIKEFVSDNNNYNRAPLFADFPNQYFKYSVFEINVLQIIHYLYGIRPKNDSVVLEPLDMSKAVIDGIYISLLDETDYNRRLTDVLLDLFAMTTVWSEVNKLIMNAIVSILEFDITTVFISHRENAMYVYHNMLNPTKLGEVLIGPTDIIKYIDYIYNPFGIKDCRYRMNREFKRTIMMAIDEAYKKPSFDMSDVSRNYNTWKLLASIIHPFDKRYKKYKNATVFFDTLLNTKLSSKYALLEKFIVQLGDCINDYEKLMELYKTIGLSEKEYPMVLRAYGRIINVYVGEIKTATAFNEFIENKVIPKVSTNGLLSFLSFVNKIFNDNDFDIVFPIKRNYIIKNSKYYEHECEMAVFNTAHAIHEELNKRFKKNNNDTLLFIDSDCYGYKLPNGNRTSSLQKKDIPKLSTIDIPHVGTIRLFLSWKNTESPFYVDGERVDLDLSTVAINEDYSTKQCYYGNKGLDCYTHSGDLTDAPITSGGATEYIDINIDKLQQTTTKFVIVYVNLYNADSARLFSDLTNAEFGIMYRTLCEGGELYEENTVINSVDLTGISKGAYVPVIIDVKNNKLVYLSSQLTSELTNNITNIKHDVILDLEKIMNNNTITNLENIHAISLVNDSCVTDNIDDASIVITDRPDKYMLREGVKIIKPWDIELVALFKE